MKKKGILIIAFCFIFLFAQNTKYGKKHNLLMLKKHLPKSRFTPLIPVEGRKDDRHHPSLQTSTSTKVLQKTDSSDVDRRPGFTANISSEYIERLPLPGARMIDILAGIPPVSDDVALTGYEEGNSQLYTSGDKGENWKLKAASSISYLDLALAGSFIFALAEDRVSISEDGGTNWNDKYFIEDFTAGTDKYGTNQIMLGFPGQIYVSGIYNNPNGTSQMARAFSDDWGDSWKIDILDPNQKSGGGTFYSIDPHNSLNHWWGGWSYCQFDLFHSHLYFSLDGGNTWVDQGTGNLGVPLK